MGITEACHVSRREGCVVFAEAETADQAIKDFHADLQFDEAMTSRIIGNVLSLVAMDASSGVSSVNLLVSLRGEKMTMQERKARLEYLWRKMVEETRLEYSEAYRERFDAHWTRYLSDLYSKMGNR